MEVRVLGAHNLETPSTRHTCFLIDGVLAVDAGSLVTSLTYDEQTQIQGLVITHHHFDHTRDIPTLGLNRRDAPGVVDVYGLGETLHGVRTHLMDGDVYPDLTQDLSDSPAKYALQPVPPHVEFDVIGYSLKPVPVPHPVPAVGYVVTAESGEAVAFSGDTGGNLLPFLQDVSAPSVLFVDVTFPNELRELADLTGHLTPGSLREQLEEALEVGIRLPRIVPVHRSLNHADQVVRELVALQSELGIDLIPGYEDMVVSVSNDRVSGAKS